MSRRSRKFRCIVADPPWSFRDLGSRMTPSYKGRGRKHSHYSVTPLEKLTTYDAPFVRALADNPSLLFLWCPNVLILEGQATAVARAWGFRPKQIVPWIKTDKRGNPRLGGGHYTRVVSESLVICTRGRATSLIRDKGIAGLIMQADPGISLLEPIIAPRTKHSAKPDESYKMIQRLCVGPRLELYARRRYSTRWTAWGNQCEEGGELAAA